MNVAFLSLGGNMGNRMENLEAALQAITLQCGRPLHVSSVYETAAWGFDSDQKYLNQVIKINTILTAHQLLKTVLDIEQQLGRTRQGHQYSDRIIDIDLLFFNADVINDADLCVPHPRLHLRKFTLVPLAQIDGNFIHPQLHKNMNTLLLECEDLLEVKKYDR